MTDTVAPTPVPGTPTMVVCGHCGASVAAGRFCSACGKDLGLHATATGVVSDALGVRQVPLRAYANTAWLAIAAPAELSRRWIGGQRVGLVSPIAMMGAVALATAFVGFFLTRWTGTREAATVINFQDLIRIAPWLKDRFAQASTAAALDGNAFNSQFQQVAGWFAALFPGLLAVPGWLSLMPWKRLDQRGSLIFAIVESVFLLILTGVHTSFKLIAPDFMATTPATMLFGGVVIGHGAIHVRGLTGSGWGYAITRPLLAMLWILPVAYLMSMLVLTVTLAIWM